jgi:hypothetical protein
VGDGAHQPPGRLEDHREDQEHHRLRLFVEVEENIDGPRPRLRSPLDEEGEAPLRALQEGRRGRGGRARHRRRQRAHLARHQAAHRGSVERGPEALSGRARASRDRSPASPTSACSSRSKRASRASSTCPQLSTERVDKPASLHKVGRRRRGRGDERRHPREADRASP